ncbi:MULTISPECIES: hypothetical protein [Microbacterium]|uniref:hypothetical protein n=1 Tax=Microbacterium TaxID=33882 RepID=UPI00217D3BF6|nr:MULTISPECIES: hypothetical protein [Microbacterium]UWF77162.1 hypothetical protein JSY13_10260 [Microbacterium neungamense]WCM55318.1 hypothetical protein JRG78_10245 [Microbacterium sp. EF45047]
MNEREAIAEVTRPVTANTASASRYNLILAVWLRHMSDVNRFEIALESALTGSRIGDRAVVLRTARHMSRILGPDSCAVEVVPSE